MQAFAPKDREEAYERNVQRLEYKFEKVIAAAAARGVAAYDKDGYDSAHDAAVDAVEAVLFGSELWANVDAVDISDIAYEAATKAINEIL